MFPNTSNKSTALLCVFHFYLHTGIRRIYACALYQSSVWIATWPLANKLLIAFI